MDNNSFLQGAAFVIEAVCEELEVSQSEDNLGAPVGILIQCTMEKLKNESTSVQL